MSNLNVNRLSTNRRSTVSFTVPDLPEIPDSVRTVSDMKMWWRTEMPAWRAKFTASLKAVIDDIKAESDSS